MVPGVIGIYGDPDQAEERRERVRRMPIYFEEERTQIGFAADPEAMKSDIRRILGE